MAVNSLSERRAVLSDNILVSVVWYGKFMPQQKDVVMDFVWSLTPMSWQVVTPSTVQWWSTLSAFYLSNATMGTRH
uniref:Uncharacterized protein n=1 Tax=Oryza brachyantha TaxID=4533 RepID=J3MRK8_ORYBR